MPIHHVLTNGRVPVKLWTQLETVQEQALQQLDRASRLPCVFKHIAVMPDVHPGEGSTIGSVIATQGAVMPSTVGVDIACGMAAAALPLRAELLRDRQADLFAEFMRAIPVGRTIHPDPLPEVETWDGWRTFADLIPEVQEDRQKFAKGLGSIGGGNHFLEICEDLEGRAWILLHSGSRNLGKRIAEVHIERAKSLMKQYFIDLPDPDLAYFVEQTPEFNRYWHDLQWAQSYAFFNREILLQTALQVVTRVLHLPELLQATTLINCHHNFVAREHHYGRNVFVTRKGAVRARKDDFGIIPGSMGAKSYIVRGRGNAESFHSCSHGAGRTMSRVDACKLFTVEDLVAQTAGITCLKDESVLDEIPGAYKPIEPVMANQSDLVEIVTELKQFICLKGPKEKRR